MPRHADAFDGEIEGSARKKLKTSRTTSKAIIPSSSSNMVPSHTKSSSPPERTADGLKSKATACMPCQHQAALNTLHTDLDAMRHLITCKICDRLLYEPYSLACGHTYCYSCLSTWLVSNRKKTCPDCRAHIAQQPNPNFVIREIALIFISKTALLPDGETSEQHYQWAKEETDIVAKDRSDAHPRTGGIFKGAFRRGGRVPLLPIHDPGDGVQRCPVCHWEIEDGQCGQCGLDIGDSDHDLAEDYLDGISIDDDISLDDEDLDEAFEPGAFENGHFWGDLADGNDEAARHIPHDEHYADTNGNAMPRPGRIHGPRRLELSSDEEESSDESHDSEMDRFVQDDDHVSMESGASDEDDSEEVATAPSPHHPNIRRRQRRTIAISDDETETAEPSVVQVDSDPDDDDEPVVTASQRNKRDRCRNQRARQAVTISSDDEDDEDESDSGNDQNAQHSGAVDLAGFSPLNSGGNDDHDSNDSNESDELSDTDHDNDVDREGLVYPNYDGGVFEGETGYAGFQEAEEDYSEDESDANGWGWTLPSSDFLKSLLIETPDGDLSTPPNARTASTFAHNSRLPHFGAQRSCNTVPAYREVWDSMPTVTYSARRSENPRHSEQRPQGIWESMPTVAYPSRRSNDLLEAAADVGSNTRRRRRISASLPDVLAEMQNRRRSEARQDVTERHPSQSHPFQLDNTLASIHARNSRTSVQNTRGSANSWTFSDANGQDHNDDSSGGSSVTIGRARKSRRARARDC